MDEKNKEYVSKFCVGCGKRVFRAKDRDIVRKAGKGRRGFTRTGCIKNPVGKSYQTGPRVNLGLLKGRRREGPGQVWVL